MQLIARTTILIHPDDAAGRLFGRRVEAGDVFDMPEKAALILIRDGEAEAVGAVTEESGEAGEAGASDIDLGEGAES